MKVLYLSNIPSPYRVAYFNELGKQCELTVLFEKRGYESRDKSWLEYEFKNFHGEFLKGINFGRFEKISFDFLKYLKKDKYDYIIVTNMADIAGVMAICWMKLNNIAYCLEGDGGFARSGKGFKEKLKKSMVSSAELCFSTSKELDKYYLTYGISKEKIRRYPFSSLYKNDLVDFPLSKSEKDKLKEMLGIKEKKIILSVGSFIKRKGMDILIKATAELSKEWGIYIVGGNPTEEYIALKEKYHNEQLHFVGFMRSEQLKKYFLASDVFVLATREDIWGLVVNEAMSYALPVITTDRCIAGLELIENGKNGFIVKTEDIDELREKIDYFVNSDELISLCSKGALEKIQGYTIEEMVKSHMEIFNENIRSKFPYEDEL